MATREEMIQEGMKYYCINCKKCYIHLPTESYEDGHGGRVLNMCRCGSDLFAKLNDNSSVSSDGVG